MTHKALGDLAGSVGGKGAGAVSYTHLDVYKRQAVTRGNPGGFLRHLC